MSALTLCLLAGGLCTATGAALAFAWAVRAGLLDEIEDVKFQLLREEDDR